MRKYKATMPELSTRIEAPTTRGGDLLHSKPAFGLSASAIIQQAKATQQERQTATNASERLKALLAKNGDGWFTLGSLDFGAALPEPLAPVLVDTIGPPIFTTFHNPDTIEAIKRTVQRHRTDAAIEGEPAAQSLTSSPGAGMAGLANDGQQPDQSTKEPSNLWQETIDSIIEPYVITTYNARTGQTTTREHPGVPNTGHANWTTVHAHSVPEAVRRALKLHQPSTASKTKRGPKNPTTQQLVTVTENRTPSTRRKTVKAKQTPTASSAIAGGFNLRASVAALMQDAERLSQERAQEEALEEGQTWTNVWTNIDDMPFHQMETGGDDPPPNPFMVGDPETIAEMVIGLMSDPTPPSRWPLLADPLVLENPNGNRFGYTAQQMEFINNVRDSFTTGSSVELSAPVQDEARTPTLGESLFLTDFATQLVTPAKDTSAVSDKEDTREWFPLPFLPIHSNNVPGHVSSDPSVATPEQNLDPAEIDFRGIIDKVKSGDLKVYSLEDPIEYFIGAVDQLPMLRSDPPEIILIGECRAPAVVRLLTETEERTEAPPPRLATNRRLRRFKPFVALPLRGADPTSSRDAAGPVQPSAEPVARPVAPSRPRSHVCTLDSLRRTRNRSP